MDMLQYMAMTQQTCQEFAEKSAHSALTEYEMLTYEMACRTVAEFNKIQEINFRRERLLFEKEHPQWEEGKEGNEGGDSSPTSA